MNHKVKYKEAMRFGIILTLLALYFAIEIQVILFDQIVN